MTAPADREEDRIWHAVADAQPWSMPDLNASEQPASGSGRRAQPPTAAEVTALHQAAQAEGFEAGYQEGLQCAANDLATEQQTLQALAAQLARPLAELDVEVERALANLALTLARRLVGREIQADPDALQSLVHQVVSHLGSLQSHVELRLHPDDLALLQAECDLDPLWELQADAELSRGDLVLRHGDTHLDARLTERVARLAADMLDGV